MRDSARQRLGRLDTCVVSDALDRLGLEGAVGGFRRWGPRRRVVGRAATVSLAPGPGSGKRSHLGTTALSTSGPEQVIVVDNAGRSDAAAWGGLLTLEAQLRFVAGVIVDGALTDVDDVDRLDVPVFARGTTPRSARGRVHEVATAEPVTIAGVVVEPGAWVVADGTGVVVIADREIARVLSVAEGIMEEETRIADALRIGASGHEVMGALYESLLDSPHHE